MGLPPGLAQSERRIVKTATASATLLVLVVLLTADSPPPLFSQATAEVLLYSEDFEDGEAQSWHLDSGWQVETDDGNYVLAGQGHQWAQYAGDAWGDYRVHFRLKLLRGNIHLNVRTSEGGQRYFIGFWEEGTSLNKQVGETFWNDLDTDDTPHALDQWHDIEMSANGGRIQVKVDDSLVLDYTDPSPLPFGSIAFETLDDSQAQIDDIAVYGPAPSLAATWVRTGGPPGGLGYDVRFWPPDKDVDFVTDAFSGVNVSEDGGRTWAPSNKGITTRVGLSADSIPVFSLTIDPNDPNIIWVGTQNVRGVYKSTDRGHTWIEKTNGIDIEEGISFRGFTVDPRSSDIVYAQAEISSFAWTPDGSRCPGRGFDMTQGAVYKTTDGGENWQEIWRGDNLARYLWIDPRNPDVLYVSTGIFDREAANTDVAAGKPGGVGILKSTDGGATWRALNEANGLANLYIGSLFMHPQDPDTLLAAAGNNAWPDNGGAYMTTDGGESWLRVQASWSMNSVEYCLSDPNIAYAGSDGEIYRSEDGGFTWELVAGGQAGSWYWGPPGVRAGFPIDMQCDPDDPNRLMVNNYGGGNFESLDGGRTWRNASEGYTGAQTRDIAVDPREPGRVYVGGRSGPWVSEDGGQTWHGLTFGSEASSSNLHTVTVNPQAPLHVLAGGSEGGTILSSSEGGLSWSQVYVNPKLEPDSAGIHEYGAIEFAPSDPTLVYAGIRVVSLEISPEGASTINSYGMYKSTDGGDTWQEMNDALTADKSITDVAVHPSDPNTVYAAAYGSGVLKTSDGGTSWHSTGSLCTKVLTLEIDPQQPDTLYAGCREGGMYKTTDGGNTWVPSSAGMNPAATVKDIVVAPTNPQSVYVATLDSGVFHSEDGGERWQAINDGLTKRSVYTLAISTDGQTLYAGTDGEGVFRLDLNGTPPSPAATSIFGSSGTALGAGWSYACYTGPEAPIETALASVAGQTSVVYRMRADQGYDRWFPGRLELSTISSLSPHEALLILTSTAATWNQTTSESEPASVDLIQGWNSVCYCGEAKDVGEATAAISGDFSILYAFDNQAWHRYVPGRPEVSNLSQLQHCQAVLVLVTRQGGTSWPFGA
jgi:photosystem II stability/assembly factor-like uncharacterized protein